MLFVKEEKNMNRIINLPPKVKYIIERLQQNGFRAYAVGGCVRDSLMGKVPNDWDICTNALPEQTLTALQKPNLIENGQRHGTVTVRYEHENFEITTFRTDGDYADHRHPQSVTFVSNVEADLARRDFTVNAMAYNEQEGLIDPFDGQADLQKKVIRCVGIPDERFNEDGLRMMRALRFSSRLGFRIDPCTSDSIHRNRLLLKDISAERITAEFNQLLLGSHTEALLTEYADIIAVFIPEIVPMIGLMQNNPHHCYDVWTHTVKVVSFIECELTLRLAAFFHDIAKPKCFTTDENGVGHFHGHPSLGARMTEEILRRMRYDNKTIADVSQLIRLHDLRPLPQAKYVRRLMRDTGKDGFLPLMALKRADARAQSSFHSDEKMAYVDRLEAIYREELRSGSAFTLKMLAVNGRDLIGLGICDGRQIGSLLKHLLELVIDDTLPNERGALLSEAKKYIT